MRQLWAAKQLNLAKLIQAGLPVPNGIAVGLSAFDGDGKLNDDAVQQVKQHLLQDKLYAVRSSALAEDAEGASWAGQFETYLDTEPNDVITKIELCHSSTKSRAKAYAEDRLEVRAFDIAVVVQEWSNQSMLGCYLLKTL